MTKIETIQKRKQRPTERYNNEWKHFWLWTGRLRMCRILTCSWVLNPLMWCKTPTENRTSKQISSKGLLSYLTTFKGISKGLIAHKYADPSHILYVPVQAHFYSCDLVSFGNSVLCLFCCTSDRFLLVWIILVFDVPLTTDYGYWWRSNCDL